ncbi:MAG: D-2-hydroxyacid dehydrogenase, partial [Halioglobus sp.]|nr:D-2-hydroxyacid dehydrogenase [Halioglobus sp.]
LHSPVRAAGNADAAQLIAELNLKATATPLQERSHWRPQRVLVMLLPAMGLDSPAYIDALQAAAGDVELVLDRSGSFVPDAESLQGVDGIIGFCSAPLLQRADADTLRWIHNYSVGMDYCTGLTPQQKDTLVFSNNQRLSAPAIAEHSMAMLLSISRNLPAYHKAQLAREWNRNLAAGVTFGELKGKTLLVAGLGGIGTEIARRAHGLGMRVIATRNSSRKGPDFVAYVGLADELTSLASEADVVVNALPLTDDTTALFNKQFFAQVKPGAIFLSVGRGRSTVTADLIAALQSGQLYGAGLDVTDPEPLPEDSPLWTMERVIITPHAAAAGSDTDARTMLIAAENLRRYVAGEPLLNVVDIERGY